MFNVKCIKNKKMRRVIVAKQKLIAKKNFYFNWYKKVTNFV